MAYCGILFTTLAINYFLYTAFVLYLFSLLGFSEDVMSFPSFLRNSAGFIFILGEMKSRPFCGDFNYIAYYGFFFFTTRQFIQNNNTSLSFCPLCPGNWVAFGKKPPNELIRHASALQYLLCSRFFHVNQRGNYLKSQPARINA